MNVILSILHTEQYTISFAYDEDGRFDYAQFTDPSSREERIRQPLTSTAFSSRAMEAGAAYGAATYLVTTTRYVTSGDFAGAPPSVHSDRTVSVTSPDPDGAGPLTAQTSSVLYDSMDRPYETTQPDGTKVYQTYYPTGEVKRTWGSQTYPVEYTYDERGRMKTLVTWQDFAGDARKATTTWNYDAQRGFLVSKVYTDASNAVYEYFPNGQLKKRTSVRGVSATYSYTDDGRLAGIDYSDATPDVSFQYDRRGRLTQVTDGIGTHAMTWTDDGQLLTEGLTTGELAGWGVAYGYDDKLRRTSLLLKHDAAIEHQNLYTYEPDSSRLHTVSDGANVVTYSYLPDSGLVDSISYRNDQDTEVLRQQAVFDNLNRLVSTTWTTRPDTVEAQVVSSHSYVLNDLNQRTKATLEDGSYWVYDYDAKGQLIAGKHYLADDSPIAGQQFEYDYDDIGNRTAVRTGGDAEGESLRTHTYAADLLNLYQQRAGALNTADIMGSAPVDTPVQVNGQSATRQGELFHAEVSADTTAASRLEPVVVAAVRPAAGPDGKDLVATDGGAVFLPQTPEIYLYDADGNLVRDSRWTYTWDAEDRLIEMVEHPDIFGQTARLRLVFAYDYTARRRAKSVYTWDASTESWTLTRHTAFVYDAWNLLAELEPVSLTAAPFVLDVANRHTWGLDLSGTLQGAGGIGGLLLTTPAATPCFPTYDGNGNVTSIVECSNAHSRAGYSYSPFGMRILSFGDLASINLFQFFGKKHEPISGLTYFGFRYYENGTGKWLSRDPIPERATELNPLCFVHNNPIMYSDALGLILYAFDGTQNDMKDDYFAKDGVETKQNAPSNVAIMYDRYSGKSRYKNGVGTRTDITLGLLFGKGGQERLSDMLEVFEADMKEDPEAPIDIIGFSRGAAMAREFANRVAKCNKHVRFLGLFDTVAQFGSFDPYNINAGIDLNIHPNVDYVAHAVAKNEYRGIFPLTSITNYYHQSKFLLSLQVATPLAPLAFLGDNIGANAYDPDEYKEFEGEKFHEKPFTGAHSDIGGGYQDYRNMKALRWMISKGQSRGAPFKDLETYEYFDRLSDLPSPSNGTKSYHDSRYPILDLFQGDRVIYGGNINVK